MDKATIARNVLTSRGITPLPDDKAKAAKAKRLANLAKANAAIKARRASTLPMVGDADTTTSDTSKPAAGVPIRRKLGRAPDLSSREGRIQALYQLVSGWWAMKEEERTRAPEALAALKELSSLYNDKAALERDAERPQPDKVCAWLTRCALDGRSVADTLRSEGTGLDRIAAHVRASLGVDRVVIEAGAVVGQSPKPRATPDTPPQA